MLVTMGGTLPPFSLAYAMVAAFFRLCDASRFVAKGLGCFSKKKQILLFAQDDKRGGMRAEGSWRPLTTFVVEPASYFRKNTIIYRHLEKGGARFLKISQVFYGFTPVVVAKAGRGQFGVFWRPLRRAGRG
jgi:hypothetical protein